MAVPGLHLSCLALALCLVASCSRLGIHSGPALDIELAHEFVIYEGWWQRPARRGEPGMSDGAGWSPSLSRVNDPRELIIIPVVIAGVVVIGSLFNAVAQTTSAGRPMPADRPELQFIRGEQAYSAEARWGENRIVLTDDLAADLRRGDAIIRLTVAGERPFDRAYRMPPLRNPATAHIRFHRDGRIYIDDVAVYEPR